MKRAERPATTTAHGMVTASPRMLALFERIERVARTDSTVLIRGETGTGKELVARAIHSLSRRRAGAFQALNCATLTAEHLASELFGHTRGAFTGAVRDRPGHFAMANGGSLFLDEIAEMPLPLQTRLLRVLQERRYVPLGGTRPQEVDVRVLAATHQALRAQVSAGRFREDLMYRVRVVTLYLPTLAERTGDIPALAWHFVDEFNGRSRAWGGRQIREFTAAALDAMAAYPWPGNVRELRNVIEQAYALGEGPRLTLADLTPELRGEGPASRATRTQASGQLGSGGPQALPPGPNRDDEAHIRAALAQAGGRKAAAAELLGISRTTLWRRMRELGI